MLRMQACHGQQCDVFVNVPTISRWQWHPFSVANVVGYSLTLNIKRYGAFTEALMDTLQSGDACDDATGTCVAAMSWPHVPPVYCRFEQLPMA